METTNVTVIGAGMAGTSVAWRLAQAGKRVLLIEREPQPGTQSTGRSAAMFMESYGPPGARALTRAGRAFYERPPAGFSGVPILHLRGALYVATDEQLPALRALDSAIRAAGTALEPVNAQDLQRLVPVLRTDRIRHGLLERDAHDIDVDALLQGFVRGARAAGARLLVGAVVAEATERDWGWRLSLSSGERVDTEAVVNAAGAWVDEVAAVFGVSPVGIQPRRRSAFMFAAPAGIDAAGWPMVSDIGEAWYFKPDAGQMLGSPANADPVPPHDVQPEELDIAVGIDNIQNATTLQIRRPTATWAGLRSFVADGDLVIGPDDAHPAFFWLAGQGGYGIQSAAGASLLAACLVRGAPLPAELTDFGVDPAVVSPLRLRTGRSAA